MQMSGFILKKCRRVCWLVLVRLRIDADEKKNVIGLPQGPRRSDNKSIALNTHGVDNAKCIWCYILCARSVDNGPGSGH